MNKDASMPSNQTSTQSHDVYRREQMTTGAQYASMGLRSEALVDFEHLHGWWNKIIVRDMLSQQEKLQLPDLQILYPGLS